MRKVCGVGVNDMPSGWVSEVRLVDGIESRVYSIWKDMIKRCYNQSYLDRNPTYVGCSVCDRWLILSNFIEDVKYIQGYDLWVQSGKREYSLDKDGVIHGNKIYEPGVCRFITVKQNSSEMNNRTYLSGTGHISQESRDRKSESLRKSLRNRDIEVELLNGDIKRYNSLVSISEELGYLYLHVIMLYQPEEVW